MKKERVQEIQRKVDAMGFKGSNEYDLHLSEELEVETEREKIEFAIALMMWANENGWEICTVGAMAIPSFESCHTEEVIEYEELLNLYIEQKKHRSMKKEDEMERMVAKLLFYHVNINHKDFNEATKLLAKYASQSKPQEIVVNTNPEVITVVTIGDAGTSAGGGTTTTNSNVSFGIKSCETMSILQSELQKRIKPVDAKTVDAVALKDLFVEMRQLISGWNATEEQWSEWDQKCVDKISAMQLKLESKK